MLSIVSRSAESSEPEKVTGERKKTEIGTFQGFLPSVSDFVELEKSERFSHPVILEVEKW